MTKFEQNPRTLLEQEADALRPQLAEVDPSSTPLKELSIEQLEDLAAGIELATELGGKAWVEDDYKALDRTEAYIGRLPRLEDVKSTENKLKTDELLSEVASEVINQALKDYHGIDSSVAA